MKGSNRVLWLEAGVIILGVFVAIALIFFIPYHPQPPVVAKPASVPSSQESVATSSPAPAMNAVPVVSSPKAVETVPVAAVPQAPETTANATPIVSISKEWPDGATPTKVIHIPDPQEPAKGLIELNLHRRDDLEMDFDPLWVIRATTEAGFAGTEVAVDSGDGFETLQEYHQNRENSGTNAWWMKSRTIRMRLLAGRSDTTYFFTVEKMRPEKLLPAVPPQTIGDLSVTFEGMRALPDRKVLVYLTFHNTSRANSIAVALYDEPCTFLPCELISSLVCSDGTPYTIYTSELTGINGIRSKPRLLTPIEPGQELKTSLKFEPRGVQADTITSVRLQSEIVVNPDYRNGEYYNYPDPGRDILPPGCMVVNMMFDIPLRPND